ncbi:MAG: hypothetical protein J6W19_06430 [Prevotella sp.]|nr:hypothetical protein [Prevotella sp.]
MKQERNDKLKASFEASLPQLPPDFTEQVMRKIDSPRPRVVRWWWAAAAACLILLAGVGITMLYKEEMPNNQEYAQVTPGEEELNTELNKQNSLQEGSGDMNADPVLGQVPVPMPPIKSLSPKRSTPLTPKRPTPQASLPDTLGSGIWQSEENVQRAVQILADCEATIRREEQEVRNDIIEATFRATPQPANAILVSNEAGDYEVIEKRNIIEI